MSDHISTLRTHQHVRYGFIGVASLLFIGILLVGSTVSAGTKFRVRGAVTEVDTKNKVITIVVTHIEKGWPAVRYENNPYTVRVSKKGFRVLKANTAGAYVRLGLTSVVKNQSVSVIGETRTDGTLDAETVIIR